MVPCGLFDKIHGHLWSDHEPTLFNLFGVSFNFFGVRKKFIWGQNKLNLTPNKL